MKKILFLSAFFIFSCTEINDVTINIPTKTKNDRGRFWNICIDGKNGSHVLWGKPVMYFEIQSKDGKNADYSIDFIHLKEKCNRKNTLVSFLNRHTKKDEWNWLLNLDAEEIEFINVGVKKNWDESEFIFYKRILSKDLN
tara:strand:+ start:428 stop:847 length:420 start_codon:yes stop_codon:yes gene_type:complete